jgi:hypothetical protein
MKLTRDESKKVLEFYFASAKSPTQAARSFNVWAAANHLPTRISKKNVHDLVQRFGRDVPWDEIKRKRPSLVNNEEVVFQVLGSLGQQPGKSVRSCAADIQHSVSTTHEIARNVLKLFPYRLAVVQALSEYDKMVRMEACHRLLHVITDDKNVIYTDEATFYTDGHVNKWNFRIWDFERPEDFYAQQCQGAPHVTVWAALSRECLFGPYFFPSTVNGETYRAVLSEFFLPALLQKYGSAENIWFQQDGAPAHYAGETRQFLYQHFGERIVSRGCPNEWPPRSPDLTPCDFYLWGVIMEFTYRNGHFNNVTELEDCLCAAFNTLRERKMDDVRRAALSVRGRLQECIALAGSQLVHR